MRYTFSSPRLAMIGSPTVSATVSTSGQNGELAMGCGTCWRTELSASSAAERCGCSTNNPALDVDLHAGADTFGVGDTIKLELLGPDAPY